tara:strand:+ start:384 stop:1037 length:654 start_codon:yes stop_codon:yes gene_type:complete
VSIRKIKFKSKAELWFPTVIWETELDNESKVEINSEILNYLDPYLKNKKLSQSNIIISETNMHEDKKTKNLNHFLNRAVFEYLKFFNLEHHDFFISGCWANVSRTNFVHYNHSHQNNFISGVYYVQTTKDKSDQIHFNDPREQNKVLLPQPSKQTKFNTTGAVCKAKSGVAYLFPSWLRHEVPVNTSNDERISIAFNAMFKDFGKMTPPGFASSKLD